MDTNQPYAARSITVTMGQVSGSAQDSQPAGAAFAVGMQRNRRGSSLRAWHHRPQKLPPVDEAEDGCGFDATTGLGHPASRFQQYCEPARAPRSMCQL